VAKLSKTLLLEVARQITPNVIGYVSVVQRFLEVPVMIARAKWQRQLCKNQVETCTLI